MTFVTTVRQLRHEPVTNEAGASHDWTGRLSPDQPPLAAGCVPRFPGAVTADNLPTLSAVRLGPQRLELEAHESRMIASIVPKLRSTRRSAWRAGLTRSAQGLDTHAHGAAHFLNRSIACHLRPIATQH